MEVKQEPQAPTTPLLLFTTFPMERLGKSNETARVPLSLEQTVRDRQRDTGRLCGVGSDRTPVHVTPSYLNLNLALLGDSERTRRGRKLDHCGKGKNLELFTNETVELNTRGRSSTVRQKKRINISTPGRQFVLRV